MIGFLVCVLPGVAALIVMFWRTRHRHDWRGFVVYDRDGKETCMLKVCACEEVRFDGFFEREKL